MMTKRFVILSLFSWLFWLSPIAYANQHPIFENPIDQKRYQSLIQETRCPTCQNSNIAESNAPLARQLREQIAELILAGRSDGEIVLHLSERYGDFIHYNPPLNLKTVLLWYAPVLLMVLALIWWVRSQAKLKRQLTPEQQQQLHTWLAEYGISPPNAEPQNPHEQSALPHTPANPTLTEK
ncbi:MAG: cytochrome c-type biogenesis protein CcmH [Cardiobacteriaceae bacterium]|nr:cytochrome c-type biogenesis protein CcmH [Cardiobacteriaceae bacterium]